MEALYDSGEQPPELVCTPGARTEMLQDLKSWSVDEGIEPILWLHGPAGVGKSTITQMFAGDCNKQGRLGASFRFRRGHPKSQTWGGLITTIAFQLVGAVPEIFMLLQQAIESDKLIFGRSIPIQFQRLLVEPFKTTSSLRIIPVVVLDGLDECADHKQQQQILRLFIKAIRDGQLPIRLLIASRPELHLREVFEDQVVVPLCRQKVLVADTVIELYLRHEFSRIHSQFGSRGIDLGESWPSSDTLNRLTHKSSGSFTYATTVIRWLDTEYSHPADRLTSVMALDPDSTVPLDDLYAQILSMFPDERRQRLVLYIMLHEPRPLALVPEDVDMVLGLSEGTSRLMLRGLRSLLQFPPLQDPLVKEEFVTPIHSSFIDYIYDARRSGKWCTSDPSLYGELFKSVVHFLSDPASTCFRMLRRKIVAQLPKLLRGITPSDDLIDLLRNTYFQQSIFIDTHGEHEGHLKWPERDSLYPLDLIQLWEDRNWIADLVCQLGGCKEVEDIDPTFKLDSIYATIFSEHPDVLSLVRALILHSRPPRTASKVPPPSALWDTLNSSLCTLKPFLVIRNLGYSFQMGDSPADFLQDRRRAGSLYYNPEGIEEEGVLDWIHSAKQPDSSRENLVSTKLRLMISITCYLP
ncbi:hypothetical protein C8J57DRAFT_1343462 [Mycena rebaudengoi]|nr:hypothetical protein C8J57DRAFT_1343462 [Mycena rebaudengoi]